MATTRDAARRRRTLKVSVDQRDWGSLQELAVVAGVSPEQLASVWIAQTVSREDARRAVRNTDGEERGVDSFRALAGESVANSHRYEISSGPGPGQSPLHHEILAVMSENGGAMTVSEIAAAIRSRGRYLAPRSGLPVTPELVSRRVSNPHYRALFEREGRLLRLAKPAKKPKP
jgi:hypothetical protein